MTLYNPLTKAFAPVPDPAQKFFHELKLSGTSYPSRTWKELTPARHRSPETDMRARTTSLKSPNAFCKRIPHFKKLPWRRQMKVRQQNAVRRVWNQVGSMERECSRSECEYYGQFQQDSYG